MSCFSECTRNWNFIQNFYRITCENGRMVSSNYLASDWVSSYFHFFLGTLVLENESVGGLHWLIVLYGNTFSVFPRNSLKLASSDNFRNFIWQLTLHFEPINYRVTQKSHNKNNSKIGFFIKVHIHLVSTFKKKQKTLRNNFAYFWNSRGYFPFNFSKFSEESAVKILLFYNNDKFVQWF